MKRDNRSKIFKTAVGALGIVCMLACLSKQVQAAGTVTVSADKTAMAVGETVTVSVQTSVPEDPATTPEVSVVYDADILTFTGCNVEYGGGGGLVTFRGQSAVLGFTAAKAGNVAVAAEAIIDDDGNNPATGMVSVTVGASGQGAASAVATLAALEITPGEMEPAFAPNVTEYTIKVDKDVVDITVSGAVSDSSAQITAASGFKNLKEGTNAAIITITAGDGSVLSYHFTIEKGMAEEGETPVEEPEEIPESEQTSNGLEVTLDEATYTIQPVIDESTLPDGCVKTQSTFNGETVEAGLLENGGLTLLYGLSASGEGEFFIYNESTGRLQIFVQLHSIENRYIVPIAPQEAVSSAFKEGKMQWNNSYIPAYVLADSSMEHADEFYLLYAVNNEGGKGYYLYDAVEGTYQRFLNYTGAKPAVVKAGNNSALVLAVIVLVILFVGSVLLIVNMIIKNKELQDDMKYAAKPKKKKPVKREPVKREPVKRETLRKEPVKKEMKTDAARSVKKTVIEPEEPKLQPVAARVAAPQPTVQAPVQAPRTELKRAQVPIFTLDREPVPLTREAPPDQFDDDFEFEFINVDNE